MIKTKTKKAHDERFFARPLIMLRCIREDLSRIDWRSRRAAEFAHSIIAEWLDEYLVYLTKRAAARRVELDRYLRNKIALGESHDIHACLLLTRYMQGAGRNLLGPDQKQILLMLPRWLKESSSEIKLLDKNCRITGDIIADIAPRQRVARFQAFARELCTKMQSEPKQFLPALLQEALDTFGNKRGSRALPTLARVVQEQSIPRLNLSQFHLLAPTVQKDLIQSSDLRHALLHPRTASALEPVVKAVDKAGLSEDAPLLEEIVEHIGAGHLISEKTQKHIRVWGLNWAPMRAAIKRRKFRPVKASVILSADPGKESIELAALQLHALSINDLEKAVLEMHPETLGKILGRVHVNSLLPTLMSGEQIGQTLTALLNAGLKPSIVIGTFKSQVRKAAKFDLRWLQQLSHQDLLNEKDLHETNAIIARRLKLKNRVQYIKPLLEPAWLQLIDSNSDGLNGFRIQFLKDLRAMREVWTEVYSDLLKILGEWLIEFSGPTINDREFSRILSSRHAPAFFERLADPEYHATCSSWREYLKQLAQSEAPLPAKVQRALKRHTLLLSQAFKRYPSLVASLALGRLPLDELLPYALKNREFGRLIDASTTFEQRLKYLDWVVYQHPGSTRSKAAHALAILIGVRFASYLAVLAQRFPTETVDEGYLFDDLYHTYRLPKQAGGSRTITVPCDPLKAVQRALLRSGLEQLDTSPWAMGFRKGKSIVDNAAAHTGADLVLNVDIAAFFPNTAFQHIRRACGQLADGRLPPMAQWLAAELCSYQGGLPMGAPSSPAVANIVLHQADKAIASACRKRGIRYTRYADDLTFSGTGRIVDILPFVQRVLGDLDYQLDDKKTNIFRKGRRQVVTGLVVNQKPNMARPLRRRLRAAVYSRIQGDQPHWRGAPMSDRELMGRIAFLGQTQPAEAVRLRKQLVEAPNT